ncbi:MAG TPA: XdhC family protein [bacterium]|nr:XdhC family protein [bacterium]
MRGWLAGGKQVGLATVIGTERSAPRGPAAVLAVTDGLEVAGSRPYLHSDDPPLLKSERILRADYRTPAATWRDWIDAARQPEKPGRMRPVERPPRRRTPPTFSICSRALPTAWWRWTRHAA